MSELPPGVREGETIAGKYRTGTVIGSGAMGTVVSAHHLLFDEKAEELAVALGKFGSPRAATYVQRIARHAAIAPASGDPSVA